MDTGVPGQGLRRTPISLENPTVSGGMWITQWIHVSLVDFVVPGISRCPRKTPVFLVDPHVIDNLVALEDTVVPGGSKCPGGPTCHLRSPVSLVYIGGSGGSWCIW